jgi:hypothetical protein
MREITNINIPFASDEIYDLHKVRLFKKWTWKKLILNQNKFWLLHNPIEQEDENKIIEDEE